MKQNSYFFNEINFTVFCLAFSLLFIAPACNYMEDELDSSIKVTTTAMDFQVVDEIPSGWNTFHYTNNSTEAHFFLLEKYPDGKTIENGRREVFPVFQKGMDLINEGKTEDAMAEFGKLPEWFSQIIYTGGSGLVSPGKSGITTLKLDPGYYVMECYVKMENGMFHSSMGMTKTFTVTEVASGNQPPLAYAAVSISGTEGISFPANIKKGKNRFSVLFKDQMVHENFVGHDINLVKLEEGHNLAELEKWMNWADPKGLVSPTPKGVIFLGGVNEMPAGNTGYFSVDLSPGKYAFISEVPDAMNKGLLKTFIVAE